MDELISRQAAIDMMYKHFGTVTTVDVPDGKFWNQAHVIRVLKDEVPPIQPEIVRCKDCEHGVLDDGFPHQYFCVFKGDEWNNADYYCGHAKRREVTI